MIYRFDQITIDSNSYKLSVMGTETPVEPQVFNLILYLIQNKDRVISRGELLDHIWKGRVVSDTSINNNIKSARKVLGDDGQKQQVIKTIHSRGYQFISKLEAVIAAEPLKTEITTQQLIVVLPFTNTKPEPDTDYLGFALANQIIGDLSNLEKFSIQPAGSIRKYVGQNIDPITAGQELQVDYVIGGDYLLENDIVRLNVEMIEVANKNLVWRESMQVKYSNTFDLQDMVAQKVAQGLDVGFKPGFLNKQHKDIPNSALAFEYYLRGISYPQSNEGHMLAVEMLQKSIELDPKYAPSYAHLGFHRRLLEQHGRIVPSGFHEAEWYYQKALEHNPLQLEALNNLSALYVETNRTEDALLITRKMLEIGPDDAHSHFALGYIYRYAGMLDEAIAEMEIALKISPNDTRFRSIISTCLSAGRYEDALSHAHLDTGDYGTGYCGMVAFEQKQYTLAKELFKKVIALDQKGIWELIAQVYLSVLDDNKEVGMVALCQLVDTNVVDAENMYYFAVFHALLHEKDGCLDLLERAVRSGYFNYPYISHNSAFHFLQHDARYISILNEAKQRHDTFRLKFL